MNTGDDKEAPKPSALYEELVRSDPDAVAAGLRESIEASLPDLAASPVHEIAQKLILEEFRKESERLKTADDSQEGMVQQ
jgi:membrane-bound lytic murein transglycosylase MltF